MKAARGPLSYEEVAFRIRRYLIEPQWVSSTTVRRTELGPEEKADPVLLWAMAQVYGVATADLSPVAAEFISTLRVLCGIHVYPDQSGYGSAA